MMDSYYFGYARCRECEDAALAPCCIFTADWFGDELALCREHLTAALEAFDAQDFGVESDAYEAAVASIKRQAEVRVKRATEQAAKWAEDERSALWRQTPEAVKYHKDQEGLIGIVYSDPDMLKAARAPWTLKILGAVR